MTTCADLGPIACFALADSSSLRAIGWLGPGAEPLRGQMPQAFFGKLCALLAEPWEPLTSAGYHQCGLCQFAGGPRSMQFDGMTIQVGASNLFVHGEGVLRSRRFAPTARDVRSDSWRPVAWWPDRGRTDRRSGRAVRLLGGPSVARASDGGRRPHSR